MSEAPANPYSYDVLRNIYLAQPPYHLSLLLTALCVLNVLLFRPKMTIAKCVVPLHISLFYSLYLPLFSSISQSLPSALSLDFLLSASLPS